MRARTLDKAAISSIAKNIETGFDAAGGKLGLRKCLTAHFKARSELFPAMQVAKANLRSRMQAKAGRKKDEKGMKKFS